MATSLYAFYYNAATSQMQLFFGLPGKFFSSLIFNFLCQLGKKNGCFSIETVAKEA
jgi:hypothetical protein